MISGIIFTQNSCTSLQSRNTRAPVTNQWCTGRVLCVVNITPCKRLRLHIAYTQCESVMYTSLCYLSKCCYSSLLSCCAPPNGSFLSSPQLAIPLALTFTLESRMHWWFSCSCLSIPVIMLKVYWRPCISERLTPYNLDYLTWLLHNLLCHYHIMVNALVHVLAVYVWCVWVIVCVYACDGMCEWLCVCVHVCMCACVCDSVSACVHAHMRCVYTCKREVVRLYEL